MKLLPVSLAIFHRPSSDAVLEIWVQRREDDGAYHGLMEFPGGGIEPGETPLEAIIREVEEEVGIKITSEDARFMGIYPIEHPNRTILLYVYLYPAYESLEGRGKWLKINPPTLSSEYQGIIPPPNHQIIDDLYRSLYDKEL